MSKKYFINFNGSVNQQDDLQTIRQNVLNASAMENANIDEVIAWTRDDIIDTSFYHNNRDLLNEERGAGFWSWKPYIILQTLDSIGKDDWVIYSDIGKPFRRGDTTRAGSHSFANIMDTAVDDGISWASNHNGLFPGIWIPHYGSAKMWTKRDCFVGMGCDDEQFHNSGHIQAGYSIWSNSKQSRAFLSEWLKYCLVNALISDQKNIYGKPNFPEFRDHRHDQSILTNLVIKNNISVYGSPNKTIGGHRNFNFILRHLMLDFSLKELTKPFNLLFDSNSSIINPNLKEVLSLLILPTLSPSSKLLVHRDKDIDTWKDAFPNSDIMSFDNNAFKTHKHVEQFDSIFIHMVENEKFIKDNLIHLYRSLKKGGVLFIGPYKTNSDNKADQHGNVSELFKWIDIHQCFPSNIGHKNELLKNYITVGNALNPLFFETNKEKKSYAILTKPKFKLWNISDN